MLCLVFNVCIRNPTILITKLIAKFSTAVANQKPNLFPYSEYIESCAVSLKDELHVPSDADLIHYLRLIYIAEEIANTFNYSNGPENFSALSEERVKFCVREFDRQINITRAKLSPLSTQSS
jgi:hypothetical protein